VKEEFSRRADIRGGSPVFWLIAAAAFVLGAVFYVRQTSFVPIDAETAAAYVVGESKDKTSSYKKYFPKPYSINDLAGGETP
jgi:hypothetical protein